MATPQKTTELPHKMWGDAIVYGPGEVKVGPDFMENAYKYAISKFEVEKKQRIACAELEIDYNQKEIEKIASFNPASIYIAHLKSKIEKFEKLLDAIKAEKYPY